MEPHLTGIFHVDVVDEFTEQPEVFFTALPQQWFLLIILHLQTHKPVKLPETSSVLKLSQCSQH